MAALSVLARAQPISPWWIHAVAQRGDIDNAGVNDAPTELLRACPQCSQTMTHLALPGRGAQPVVVDQCASCRLVWFDAMESVQLAGLGWVRLLRELQRGVHGEPPASRPPALACPSCQVTLKPVHNATRFGRFPALECPGGHGHLHSHSGMLAERGLVRPLLGPERRALAQERRTIHCLNCGAACDGSGDECSYCASPLVVIDLPRLATALRQRAGHWSDTPPPAGVPLAWPCRGCGRALDPSRQAACASCGHAVVAPSLLDIAPLLASIEHELRSAHMAARPYRRKPERPPRTWRDTAWACSSACGVASAPARAARICDGACCSPSAS
jgi:Zn-finger nucleic acid-binding protein